MSQKYYLINKFHDAEQRAQHVPGRGDPELMGEFRVVLTRAERDAVIAALHKTPPDAFRHLVSEEGSQG